MSMSKKHKANEASTSVRLYHEEWFFKFGAIEKNQKTLCILCKENITTRSYNVKRHFETVHKNLVSLTDEEKKEYFMQELKKHQAQTNTLKSFVVPKKNITSASFQLAHSIAKHGKPLSEGEFFKKALLDCSESLFSDFKEKDLIIKRIKELSISRNTVKDRIITMDENTSMQLISDLKNVEMFSVSLDESTDITGQAQLAIIAKYKSANIMREELIKLVNLTGKTTGVDIMDAFKEEFKKMNIDIKKIVSVTTDGAPSMVGKNVGFITQLKQYIGRSFVEFNCIIHQEVLCVKKGLQPFSKVMATVTNIVNFISARALNKRQFAELLSEIDSQYSGLLMYNNVRWLSRGLVLNRFVSLLNEIRLFLHEKDVNYPELTNLQWLNDLMFFCDITQHFNELNKKLQGRGQIALNMYENIKSFVLKLDIFIKDLNMKTLKYFPHLLEHFKSSAQFGNDIEVSENKINNYVLIIEEIKESFENRFIQFKQLETSLQFIMYPHKIEFKHLELKFFNWLNINNLEIELVEFQNSFLWRNKFEDLVAKIELNNSQINFNESAEENIENIILQAWNSMPNTFICMKNLANAVITMFGSTYFCEQLFSSMNYIKSSERNRLGKELTAACVRLRTTNYKPDIQKLSFEKQQQISH